MYIKCIHCDVVFRNNITLSQHFINNFCQKYNILVVVNNCDNNKNETNKDKNNTNNTNCNTTKCNIKLNRLKRREEINKYIEDIKKFPEKDGTCIDMLCKEIIKNYPRYL